MVSDPEPRGVRNANPGNIRRTRTLWQGEAFVQADPDFVTFSAPLWGLRAIAKILKTYQANGLDTVREIISRWAPEHENDTEAYVKDVALTVGVDADARLDLTNPGLMAKLIKAIVRHENGQQPYADALIAQAIGMTQARAA